MKTFEIKFIHTVEIHYNAKIEAKNKEEAESLFDESPFDFIEGDGVEGDGIDLVITNITELN